ncbi:MAG: ABC transporter ATP-binding protein [Desulfobulbus sp.]|nr:ABC transporter ATP-binding protein [Desulfobulbus sp.]
MIQCNHIFKSYPINLLRRRRKQAIHNINFNVRHNEVFGIIGLNGAGKSSILKILMGFIHPDSGAALIAGNPASAISNRTRIGYLPEHPSLYPNLSVNEHLYFGCRCGGLGNQEATTRIREVLKRVGLTEVAQIPIKRFSKGMTQRAALAYSILLAPEILILDEPMSGLDPLGRQLVIDIIHEYQDKGSTILFCSHILTDVERICDRIGIMHQGNLVTIISTPLDKSEHKPPLVSENGKTRLEALFLDTVQRQEP